MISASAITNSATAKPLVRVLVVGLAADLVRKLSELVAATSQSLALLSTGEATSAIRLLQQYTVGMVVAGPEAFTSGGGALLRHLAANYPHLPVIICGPAPAPLRPGSYPNVVDRVAADITPEELLNRTLTIIRQAADGGVLHDVSLGVFAQLIEMDKKTCTVRVSQRDGHGQGYLFFSGGALVDAVCDGLRGQKAACVILAWSKADLAISNTCMVVERKINTSLTALLLEAMRLRDEIQNRNGGPQRSTTAETSHQGEIVGSLEPPKASGQSISSDDGFDLLGRISKLKGVEDLYFDPTWAEFIDLAREMGDFLAAGNFKAAVITPSSASPDLLLFPRHQPMVVTIDRRAICEEVLEAVLNELSEV